MPSAPEGVKLQENGAGILTNGSGHAGHGFVHLQNVVSVDPNRVLFGNAVPRSFVYKLGTSELLTAWGRQSPVVAFDAENDGQLPYRRHIQGFVEIPFAGSAISRKDQSGFA